MAGRDDVEQEYRSLDGKLDLPVAGVEAVRPDLLVTFAYEHPEREAEVLIDTQEFTALCPWTGLPDFGRLEISYVPAEKLLELKSLKYYLLTYRQVGIVQEHAAARVLDDLVAAVAPRRMRVVLDYEVRGGLHTVVSVEHP